MRSWIFFLLFFSFLSVHVNAQFIYKDLSNEFVIDFLTVKDGLISNYISKTVSDSNNVKYFATEAGISRYNGYTFKTFRPGSLYPKLLNENIETLFKDRDNNIWIGTKSGGLSMLEVSLNKILDFNEIFKIRSESQLRVMSLNQDNQGHIWVGTWSNGVFVIDPKDKKLINHYTFNNPILKIILDKSNNINFVSGREFVKVNVKKNELISTKLPYFMNSLIEDKYRNKIWMVGNFDKKVKLLSIPMGRDTIEEFDTKLEAKFLKSIAIDSKNRIWLGSWGDGLFISDTSLTMFQHVDTNPYGSKFENINNSSIIDIEIDKNDIAWLGTANGGVLILYPNKGFSFITNSTSKGVVDHNAISLFESKENELFIGTLADGLFIKGRNNEFIAVKGVPKTRVNVIIEEGNYLFVGTNKGLVIFKDRDFNRPILKFENEKITTICLDKNDNLWIGTQQTGLKVTNLMTDPNLEKVLVYSETGKDQFYIENNRINKIIEDQFGTIWLATYAGINRYHQSSQRFITHNELISSKFPSVIINDIYAKGSTIYAATPVGFIQLMQKDELLSLQSIYDSQGGLPNDFICAIAEDNSGKIWISTITSLIQFDPLKKTFSDFSTRSGIMVKSFHIGSSAKDTKGNIYFGGNNGLVQFDPTQIMMQPFSTKVIFTDIIVNNSYLNVGDTIDGRVILTKEIDYIEKLNLGYKQNHLTILFSTNDYLSKDYLIYQYRMIGTKSGWINIRERKEISFTGLRPGKYKLEIRASRDRQKWSQIKSIEIAVASPPWASWYAYLFYAICGIVIIYLINYISSRQAKLESKLKIAQIENEKEHDLNEAKLSFYTNISHEFRTPLTLILSPVTEMLSDISLNPEFRNKLTLVDNNANRLLNLINQLLDFRKSEYGLLQLNIEKTDFVSFAKEVFHLFQDISKSRNIAYKFETEIDQAILPFDRDKMEIVLCNIISNAFKFSNAGGEVSMYLFITDGYLNIEIHDKGIGLSEEEAEKVFDRYYQALNIDTAKVSGSGIGLAFAKSIIDLHHGSIHVKSEQGKQTCFTVKLLLANTHLQSMKETLIQSTDDGLLLEELDGQASNWMENQTDRSENQPSRELVLVVDDNEDIRNYLTSLLKEDYDILEAGSGVSALQIAKSEFPDIIISDIMMPEMDGIMFCKEIKSHIITSHIPVILLTARTSTVYELSGLETGADDYITKPFNPIILKSRIHNILENRRKLKGYFLNKVRFEPDKQIVESNDIDEIFLEKAIKLVNDNISNEEFSIDKLMEELYMSRSTLYRKIKSLTGLSITAFIRSVRLKKAAQLILTENMKLSQVAFEVGINDYKHFRLSFQQQFDCLPSDYKATMMNKQKKSEIQS